MTLRLSIALAALLTVAGCRVETGPPESNPADTYSVETLSEPSAPDPSREARTRRTVDPSDTLAAPTPSDSTRARSARADSARASARRDQAMAALLDLAERADGADAQALARGAQAVENRLALVERSVALDSLRQAIRTTASRGDRANVALQSARAYRLLSETSPAGSPTALRADALVVSALARAPLPDWRQVERAAADLARQWGGKEARVQDVAVRGALAESVAAVTAGANSQNAALVRLGASVVVDLADTARETP